MEGKSSKHDGVFECKTCNRQFQSFQALGGHRASHNRSLHLRRLPVKAKAKTHECSICGSEFGAGQALGGHMRRHRASKSHVPVVVMKKSRVLCLDLNLTPVENDFNPPPMLQWPAL